MFRIGRAGRPAEYFDPYEGHQKLWIDLLGVAGPGEYFEKIVAEGSTKNGVFTTKLHWHQIPALLEAFDAAYGADPRGIRPQRFHSIFEQRFETTDYVWMRRRNKIAQGISHYRADYSGLWHIKRDEQPAPGQVKKPVPFDFDAIDHYVKLAERHDQSWRQYLVKHRLRALVLIYEDFIANYEETVRGVYRHLRLDTPDLVIPPPSTEKMADDASSAWEREYLAIKQAGETTIVAGAKLAPAAAKPPPRIFVNIASYRDSECQWTIKDLFEKAHDPDRIFVGVCNQLIEAEDAHCLQVVTRPKQVRELRFDARESQGCCWARAQGQSLWLGEEYMLQIDSHMRFVPGWDEKLLTMLAALPSEKPVLSSYAPLYWPPDKLETDRYVSMRVHHFYQIGGVQIRPVGMPLADAPPSPTPTPFACAHFMFGPSAIMTEVPYDPHVYFWGEEILLAIRLWTNGWDIFVPNQVIVYHRMDHTGRPRHWDDKPQGGGLMPIAARRVHHLLEIERCDDPAMLPEIERYGFGSVRSLREYEAFSGIDFRRRLVHGRTDEQIMIADPVYRRRRNEEIFQQIGRANLRGPAKSWSGPDSDLPSTEALRTKLPQLFHSLQIRILADAGCGDAEWTTRITGALRFYLGFDVASKLLPDARKRHGHRRGHFFADADITVDLLPVCDAILCRDVLTYLALEQSLLALALFKQSGARFLFATTYAGGENRPTPTGACRPLCLTAPPFNLPPPLQIIPEPGEAGKALGVWEIKDIQQGQA